MPYALGTAQNRHEVSFTDLLWPIENSMNGMPPLLARGNRPLQMTFEDQIKALVFFHLEEHTSAQHLLQVLEEDDFARKTIAPQDGIKKAALQKPSIQEALSSSCIFTKTSRVRLLPFYRRNIRTSENS